MPLLFLERFPWPSLQTYTALSVALLAGSIFSAYTTVTDPGYEVSDMDEPSPIPSGVDIEDLSGDTGDKDLTSTVLGYLVADSLFVWVSYRLLKTVGYGYKSDVSLFKNGKVLMHSISSGVGQHSLLLSDADRQDDPVYCVWAPPGQRETGD